MLLHVLVWICTYLPYTRAAAALYCVAAAAVAADLLCVAAAAVAADLLCVAAAAVSAAL